MHVADSRYCSQLSCRSSLSSSSVLVCQKSQGIRLPASRKLDAGGVHRFSIVFQLPVTVKGTFMPKRIRLACSGYDTDDGDGISSIPSTWKDVTEVQSLAESRKVVTADDKTRSAFEWYTHLGICPQCQKEDD